MTDLLRPEIMQALAVCDKWLPKKDKDGNPTARQILRAELERQAEEIMELRSLLDDPGTTHSKGCWTWGPKHYRCAENRIKALEAELAAMRSKWEAAPVGRVENCDMTTMRPTWHVMDDRDRVSMGIGGKRVRLVVEDSE